MTFVQSSLLSTDITATSLHDASFAKRGENVVILGARGDIRRYAEMIEDACHKAGLKLAFANGGHLRDSIQEDAPELLADLLMILDRPRPRFGDTDGDYFAELLKQRVKAHRSTILLSATMPLEWIKDHFLGHATFWTVARLGMGMILDFTELDRRALIDRIRFPNDQGSRQFFNDTKVASLGWIRDPVIYEYFDIKGEIRPWHWVNLHKPG